MADELVKRFVDLHKEAEELLEKDKVKDAKTKYLEVVDAYHNIEQSSLDHFHKEVAHEQISTLFNRVTSAKERIKIPVNLIVAAGLVIAFSFFVLFNPSIVGLASFEDAVRHPVDLTFDQSGVRKITLRDRPLSLAASGEFTGTAKLYVKKGKSFELIFDSTKSPSSNGKFVDVCEQTCDLNIKTNVVELFANVDNGTLHVSELIYKIPRSDNSAPRWTSKSRTFQAKIGKPLALDLDDHFTDDEGDELTYLSTTTEGLEVSVQNNLITILPSNAGQKSIMLIASDLIEVTRVSVIINVE